MPFKQLPVVLNAEGNVRKVGFELEFAQLKVADCVLLVQKLYGGTIEKAHRFSQKVVGTSLGDFSVEIDLKLLTEKKYKALFDTFNLDPAQVKLGSSTLEDKVESALESVIQTVIPYEISAPPIPCTQLEKLEPLRQALHEHGAEGTEAFLTNAFGTHINTELPDSETATVLRYLRAFLVLYPWLLEEGQTDFARRMTSFINPFPAAYVLKVLEQEYQPSLDQLIDDYHTHNPDRNRPLDLYPLFAFLNEEKVNSLSNLGTVKARNTFHYRLPNSCISSPNWTLAQEWNNWVIVEEVANNPELLRSMCQDYLLVKEDTLLGFEQKWTKKTQLWLFGEEKIA